MMITKKVLLGSVTALLVANVTTGTAHALDNFRPRGPFGTLQECNRVKSLSAQKGEQQGAGACFTGNQYGVGYYYMVRNQ
ncbi:hypothetical protein [Pseudonocardia spinosispora]|uniref:hypothetical protein n=1 Tax=Pseudonocardia spinosispora TaxID=103441 RepID=UPI00048BCFFB|nr:hypothetical protein [Pseudonocardia spinosispora]